MPGYLAKQLLEWRHSLVEEPFLGEGSSVLDMLSCRRLWELSRKREPIGSLVSGVEVWAGLESGSSNPHGGWVWILEGACVE